MNNIFELMQKVFTEPALIIALSLYALVTTKSDVTSLKISDDTNFAMIILGIGFNGLISKSGVSAPGGAIAGFLIILIPAVIFGARMGGDIKFTSGLGSWVGTTMLLPLLGVATFVFTVYAILTGAGAKKAIPFAPFLSSGVGTMILLSGYLSGDMRIALAGATLLYALIILVRHCLSDPNLSVRRSLGI